MDKLKKKNGITLIALIVTIIILLILLAILILSIRDNRLLENTGKAKIEVIKGEVKEQIHLDIYDISTKEENRGKKPTLQTLHDDLPKEDKRITMDEYKDEDKKTSGTYEYDKNHEYIFEIDEGQNITGIVVQTNAFDIETSDITTKSVKVAGDASNLGNIKEFTYVAKRNDGNQIKKEHIKEQTSTIYGLKDNTKYNVYMIAADAKGNYFKSKVKKITTLALPDVKLNDGVIKFSDITWKDGKASVTISTNTDYKIQYQTVQDDKEGEWIEGNKVDNLKNNDEVNARVTDGTNGSDYTTIKITDTIPPTVTLAQGTTTVNSIEAKVTATDEQSGVASYTFFLNDEEKQTGDNTTFNATGLQPGVSYTIKVVVKDNAGNSTEKSITITTKDHNGDLKNAGGVQVATEPGGLYNTPYYYYSVTTSTPYQESYSCNCSSYSYSCNCSSYSYSCNCKTMCQIIRNVGTGDSGYSETCWDSCETCSSYSCDTCYSSSCSTCYRTAYRNVTNNYYGTSYSGTLIATYYKK